MGNDLRLLSLNSKTILTIPIDLIMGVMTPSHPPSLM